MIKKKFFLDRDLLPALPATSLAKIGVLLSTHDLSSLPALLPAAGKQGCLCGMGPEDVVT